MTRIPVTAAILLFTPLASSADEAEPLVKAVCQACHGYAIVEQQRLDADDWRERIRWMQEKQGLWDLGDQEPAIIRYLVEHHGPATAVTRADGFRPRRANLTDTD